MRVFVFSLFVTFFSFNLQAQSKNFIQRMIENEAMREFGFHKLIKNRCNRYMPTYVQKQSCSFAARELIEILNFDVEFIDPEQEPNWETGAFIFLAFEKAFMQMMHSETVANYLKALTKEFAKFHYENFDFNLWDFTLERFKGNAELATYMIAVLFQDTSNKMLHIEYAQRMVEQKTEFFQANLNRLRSFIQIMLTMNEANPEKFIQTVFPRHKLSFRNYSLYHFYVPMYLAQRLKAKGYSAQVAGQTAFMMTVTYEMISTDSNYKKYLFNDPLKITSEWKIRDIFQGYEGAMMGAGIKSNSYGFASLYLKESSLKGIRYLLKP